MNSAPVLEAPPVAATPQALPALPIEETSDQPFGEVLDEVTDEVDENSETEPSAESKEKKKESLATDVTLVCFCPPPVIDTPTLSAVPQGFAVTAPKEADDIQQPASPSAPTLDSISAPASLLETVAPKPFPANEEATSELDPKLFQPVLPEATPTDAKLSKTSEAQAPPVTNATHGTLVAQLENRVKNSGKTAEIAPAIEQKMPMRDILRRAVAEVSRVESFQADKPTDQILSATFAAESRETVPVKAAQAVHLVESIRTEVANIRQRSDTTMTVVLRPDSGTQLSLDISIARDGSVHAQARCERGDFQSLQAQWPQLQQSLAAHGIKIADLANQNNAQQQNHRPASAFENPDRGQSRQQSRDTEFASFEQQLSVSKTKISTAKPISQQNAGGASARRWQSWA